MYKRSLILLALFCASLLATENAQAQKVGFISSDEIREYFPEAKLADQRLQSIVEEWKRELKSISENIAALEDEIEKNRLVWSDKERRQKVEELRTLKKRRKTYAKEKFGEGGEYDKAVQMLMKKVEEKIYAATQKIAAEEGYDIVFDKSVQPLPYVNFKYDLTVKVLSELGVDTDKLEEELEAKIANDPRNKRKKSKYAPSKRRRRRSRRVVEEKPIENKQEQSGEKTPTKKSPEGEKEPITPKSPIKK